MNAEKILSQLNTIESKYFPDLHKYPEYQDLVQGLKEDIALAEQKKSGKADRFKAALRFSKYVNKANKNARPAMAGAYINKNGQQEIFHSYMAVRYETPFDGLIEAEEGDRVDFGRCFQYDSRLPVELPSLAELKTKLKTDKATGNVDKCGNSLTELQGVYFNTQYLIWMMECVEPTEAYFSNDGKFPMLAMVGDGAGAVVCPLRVTEGGSK